MNSLTKLHNLKLFCQSIQKSPSQISLKYLGTARAALRENSNKHEKQPTIHSMKGMSMLTLKEFSEQQIEELIWTALDMKMLMTKQRPDNLTNLLQGKFSVFLKKSYIKH